jgi:hypothetical protein
VTNVAADADGIRTLLIKLVDAFDRLLDALPGQADKARRRDAMAEEVEAPADAAHESLVGVLPHFQFRHRFIDAFHCRTKLPASRGEDHPIVHEADV